MFSSKNKLKYCIKISTLFLLIFNTLCCNVVFAKNNISSATTLNLAKGRVNGEKVDYVIYMPTLWASTLTAEREKVSEKGLIEKVSFYYNSTEKNVKPAFFMSFYLYDKRKFKTSASVTELFETDDYIFAISKATSNNLKNQTDKAIFKRLQEDLEDVEYVTNFFKLPSNQSIVYSNKVSVNGKRLKGETVFEDGIVYVPVREACEELGYSISYIKASKAVAVSKGSYYYLISASYKEAEFKSLIINGKIYAPTAFFIRKLNINTDIDENYNVDFTG